MIVRQWPDYEYAILALGKLDFHMIHLLVVNTFIEIFVNKFLC